MAEKTIYQELAERIGGGDSKIVPEVFGILADENEAKLLLAASPPATVDELVEKSGLEAETIEQMVEPLFKKGLLFKSKKKDAVRYYGVRHVFQLFESTGVMIDPPQEMLDLWKKFIAEEYDEFIRKYSEAIDRPLVRVIPVNVSVEAKTQILAFDDVNNMVNKARNIAVTKCGCRAIDGSCGKPVEVCMQFDKAADYALERGTGRELAKQEALDMLRMCEEEGLIHVGDNQRGVGHLICNCCSDCCINWPGGRTGAAMFVAPSRFLVVVDADLCSACETCLERCYFDALSIDEETGTARVEVEKCMGCGVCLVTCPEEAISLSEVRPEDFVPPDPRAERFT